MTSFSYWHMCLIIVGDEVGKDRMQTKLCVPIHYDPARFNLGNGMGAPLESTLSRSSRLFQHHLVLKQTMIDGSKGCVTASSMSAIVIRNKPHIRRSSAFKLVVSRRFDVVVDSFERNTEFMVCSLRRSAEREEHVLAISVPNHMINPAVFYSI
jgi:hypothetical protein